MANNSNRTDNFGPLVSYTTTKAHASDTVHVLVPSYGTFTGAGTNVLSGTNTLSGAVVASGGLQVGASGTNLDAVYSSAISVSLGAVAANDSVSTTATIAAINADSVVLSIQPESIWSGAYYDINVQGQATADNTLTIWANNSAITSVTPDAMTMTVVHIDPA